MGTVEIVLRVVVYGIDNDHLSLAPPTKKSEPIVDDPRGYRVLKYCLLRNCEAKTAMARGGFGKILAAVDDMGSGAGLEQLVVP